MANAAGGHWGGSFDAAQSKPLKLLCFTFLHHPLVMYLTPALVKSKTSPTAYCNYIATDGSNKTLNVDWFLFTSLIPAPSGLPGNLFPNPFITPLYKTIISHPFLFAQPSILTLNLWPGFLFHWDKSSHLKITSTY